MLYSVGGKRERRLYKDQDVMELFKDSPRLATRHILIFILAAFIQVGCLATNGFPTEAQKVVEDAVKAYYTSPWLGSTHYEQVTGIEITRSWRAKDLDNGAVSGEMWCVDLLITGKQAGSPEEVSAVWIVTREDAQGKWQSAALETISANSTIERCRK